MTEKFQNVERIVSKMLGDVRAAEIEIAKRLQPMFEGLDVDDSARLCNIVAGIMIDQLAGLGSDRAKQSLGSLAAYAKISGECGPQAERAKFLGKGS